MTPEQYVSMEDTMTDIRKNRRDVLRATFAGASLLGVLNVTPALAADWAKWLAAQPRRPARIDRYGGAGQIFKRSEATTCQGLAMLF
jgi:hypothetical protein